MPDNGGTANWRFIYRSVPSTPYTITVALMHALYNPPSSLGNRQFIGFGFRDGAGKYVLFVIGDYDDSWNLAVSKQNSYSSGAGNYNAVSGTALMPLIHRQPLWLQVQDDGTNLTFNYSIDAEHWVQFDQRSRTDFMTSGPNAIALGGYCERGGIAVSLISYAQS